MLMRAIYAQNNKIYTKRILCKNLWRIQVHEGVDVDKASVLRNFRQMEACI